MRRLIPPRLCLHARGLWFVKWGGRQYYFTRDELTSRQLFLGPSVDQGGHPGSLAS